MGTNHAYELGGRTNYPRASLPTVERQTCAVDAILDLTIELTSAKKSGSLEKLESNDETKRFVSDPSKALSTKHLLKMLKVLLPNLTPDMRYYSQRRDLSGAVFQCRAVFERFRAVG